MRHVHPSRKQRQQVFNERVMPTESAMERVLDDNIASLLKLRREAEARRTVQDRIADALTAFSGSMTFVYFHVVWFAVWISINLHATPLRAFDPFPFGLLTMIVSLEAIFLSTFVLISQNRSAGISDRRADLDLQINLLAEQEITRLLALVDAIADHLGIAEARNPEIDDFERQVTPEEVLREMAQAEGHGEDASQRVDKN